MAYTVYNPYNKTEKELVFVETNVVPAIVNRNRWMDGQTDKDSFFL